MKKILSFFLLVSVLGFLISPSACAEEEIGLIQKLWRKFFGKPAVEKKIETKPSEGATPDEKVAGDETPEEREAKKALHSDLERQREERQLLENIRRTQEAQKASQQPTRLPPRR